MAITFSLAQFNKIATGDYNAGQIDVKIGENGAELVKVNNFVVKTSKNNVVLSPERILEVKPRLSGAASRRRRWPKSASGSDFPRNWTSPPARNSGAVS